MRRRHKQQHNGGQRSNDGAATSDVGLLSPSTQASPKVGTLSPRKRWVCVFFLFFFFFFFFFLCGLSGYWKQKMIRRKRKRKKEALIPTRVSDFFVQSLSLKREKLSIYIYIKNGPNITKSLRTQNLKAHYSNIQQKVGTFNIRIKRV